MAVKFSGSFASLTAIVVSVPTGQVASGTLDGTKLYLAERTNNTLYSFNMTSPWDITTASLDNSVQPTPDQKESIFFKSDGTRIFYFEAGDLLQYDLGTPWDITTVANRVRNNTLAVDTDPESLYLLADGLSGYIASASTGNVFGISLSSPFDISTITVGTNYGNFGESNLQSITFSSDGTRFYLAGNANDTVEQFDLTTSFDLGSTTAVGALNVGNNPTGIFFRPDGTRLFVAESGNQGLTQYNLTTPWDVTTGSSAGFLDFSVTISSNAPRGIAFGVN